MDLPPFDQKRANDLIGKYIIVGMTTYDREGKPVSRQQVHGVITRASQEGILIELRGTRDGQTWNMPPDLGAILPAEPGNYMLKETSETVYNPDFTATWDIHHE